MKRKVEQSNVPQEPPAIEQEHTATPSIETKPTLTAIQQQMAGTVKTNAESKLVKIQRMRTFAESVIDEFRQGNIDKGVWKLAEEQGISLGTLSRWTSDPDWTTIAAEMKLARLLTLEHKVNRAIVNGVGVQLLSNLLGIWNRLDPQAQQVNGVMTHVSIVSAVRAPVQEEDRARIMSTDN
jgi:hypothetical protein